MKNESKPTGNPNCPPHIQRPKDIQKKIEERQSVVNSGDIHVESSDEGEGDENDCSEYEMTSEDVNEGIPLHVLRIEVASAPIGITDERNNLHDDLNDTTEKNSTLNEDNYDILVQRRSPRKKKHPSDASDVQESIKRLKPADKKKVNRHGALANTGMVTHIAPPVSETTKRRRDLDRKISQVEHDMTNNMDFNAILLMQMEESRRDREEREHRRMMEQERWKQEREDKERRYQEEENRRRQERLDQQQQFLLMATMLLGKKPEM